MGNIYVSHVSEDAAIADFLKTWLPRTSAGQWKVFISSDRDNSLPGSDQFSIFDNWLAGQELHIALCSPAAMQHLWLGYEVGYAVAKNVHIIPVHMPALDATMLPPFLLRYNGIRVNDDKFRKVLFAALQKYLPLPGEIWTPDAEIAAALAAALGRKDCPSVPSPDQILGPNSDRTKNEDCIEVLRKVAEAGAQGVSLAAIAGDMPFSGADARSYCNILQAYELIATSSNGSGSMKYNLTDAGRAYVHTNGIL